MRYILFLLYNHKLLPHTIGKIILFDAKKGFFFLIIQTT